MRRFPIVALLAATIATARAADFVVPPVVVTARPAADPFEAGVRPEQDAARAHDVTELLRALPGVTAGRLGGAGGEPFYRGLGGSRLPVVVDGIPMESVCNHRMDPATASLSPDSVAAVSLVRGPYSVRNGPAVAGVVELERDAAAWREPGFRARATATVGSFERIDRAGTASLATGRAAFEVSADGSRQDDYRAGGGPRVFSHFARYSENVRAAVALAPALRFEAEHHRSDGEAAFPSFHMDATRLDTEQTVLRLVSDAKLGWVTRLRASVSDRAIDHAMDDYTMRPSVPRIITTATRIRQQTTLLDMLQTQHGRVARADVRLEPTVSVRIDAGFEHRHDRFDARNRSRATECVTRRATGATTCTDFGATDWAFYDLAWVRDGLWVEARHAAGDVLATAGWRRDVQETRVGALFDFNGTIAQPGAGATRSERIDNGFVRVEWAAAPTLTLHGGIAATDRPADFMERVNFTGGALLDAERSRQIDAGLAWRSSSASAEFAWFRAHHPNLILVSGGTVVVQEQVRRDGVEARFDWTPAPRWTLRGMAAAVFGRNTSRDVPLAQTPPPEATLAVAYDAPTWGLATAWRAVRRQTLVDPGYGNTLGVDLGPTAGFATLRAEGWWTPTKALRLGAAVENLFDRFYQEHVSRTGSFAPAGFVPTTRVPEPGRALWFRVRLDL